MCSYKLLSSVSIELVIFLFTYLGIGLAVLALWYELMCYGTKWVYNYDWKTYYYTAKESWPYVLLGHIFLTIGTIGLFIPVRIIQLSGIGELLFMNIYYRLRSPRNTIR
jgi:hypothetical protein